MSVPQPTRSAERARTRGRLLLFVSAVLFGLTAMLARLATLGGMTGGQATLIRFVMGSTLVLGLFRIRPGTFHPSRFGLLVTRGAFGGAAALLYFQALERIPTGEATLLNNLCPMFAVCFSIVALGERPTLHLALALLLAGLGVFLVVGGGQVSIGLGWGEGMALLSAVSGGVAITAIRALRSTVNAPTVFSSFCVGGLIASVPFGFGVWSATPLSWVAAITCGLAAFFAQLAMTEALGALSIPESALWQMLTPVMSYLFALTLGETIGWVTGFGVLLGLSGVAYGSLFGQARRVERSDSYKWT